MSATSTTFPTAGQAVEFFSTESGRVAPTTAGGKKT